MTEAGPSIHASAVLVGRRGVLIRGPSGSGKSLLAARLVETAPFGAWIADDRVLLAPTGGRVVATAPTGIAGRYELRGYGLVEKAFVRSGVIDLVVDLASADTLERMPEPATIQLLEGAHPLPLLTAPARASTHAALLVHAALDQMVAGDWM